MHSVIDPIEVNRLLRWEGLSLQQLGYNLITAN